MLVSSARTHVRGARSRSQACCAAPAGTGVPQPSAGVLFPPRPAGPSLLPGLNVDPEFWRARLAALNEAESQVEALEWRIVHSALDTIHRYVESVVVPAVEHAEKGGKMR